MRVFESGWIFVSFPSDSNQFYAISIQATYKTILTGFLENWEVTSF